ncbi:MAG: type II toxin-antitoxin system RelE/ParE family toxin [Treponemataceae bacterium]|nr:MAG: type II toxin-antitoxin system RelE/ParE family toxin [Treponemataceae bacterium]
MVGWEILTTDEYGEWFLGQSARDQVLIHSRVELLKRSGPNLSRPYADTLKGSKIKNLKELRIKTMTHAFRIAYLFDEKRNGLLLIGGDKKGKVQNIFYKNLIADAERIYSRYLAKRKESK